MATQDKVMLMHKVEGTLKTRMFANLLEEATSEIQEHLEEFDITHINSMSNYATEDLVKTYIDAKRVEGRTEKTLVHYQYVIERFMKYVSVKTREVNTYHIRDYFTHEQARGISDRTIEGIRQALNSYFGWLEQEKMIHMNPVFNVGSIKCEKKVKESFGDTDIERIKRVCQNKRDIAIVQFLMSTGCRISEVVALNRSDIDFSKGECVVFGKGRKERTVYLDDVATMTLKEYLASRNDDDEALFISKMGKRFLNGGIRAMLKKLGETAGVVNVHPHRFRRTLITRLLDRGMSLQDVAIVAGHDKMDTTMKYYSYNKNRIKSSYMKFYR